MQIRRVIELVFVLTLETHTDQLMRRSLFRAPLIESGEVEMLSSNYWGLGKPYIY